MPLNKKKKRKIIKFRGHLMTNPVFRLMPENSRVKNTWTRTCFDEQKTEIQQYIFDLQELHWRYKWKFHGWYLKQSSFKNNKISSKKHAHLKLINSVYFFTVKLNCYAIKSFRKSERTKLPYRPVTGCRTIFQPDL